jgi:trans-2,3-dihydro-3-hydroxyanthranilate isomerase
MVTSCSTSVLDTFSKEDFTTFSNLSSTDFEDAFPIQEVTTGSAFVIVLSKIKSIRAFNYR